VFVQFEKVGLPEVAVQFADFVPLADFVPSAEFAPSADFAQWVAPFVAAYWLVAVAYVASVPKPYFGLKAVTKQLDC